MSAGVVIIGGGGHAKVVIESLRASGQTVAVIVDADATPRQVLGVPVVGDDAALADLKERGFSELFVALGSNRLRQKLEPPITPSLPAGLDPCDVPAQVLDDYRLGTQDVSFAPPGKRLAQAPPQEELAEIARQTALDGSNNWVIAGSRTATGSVASPSDARRSPSAEAILPRRVLRNDPGASSISFRRKCW